MQEFAGARRGRRAVAGRRRTRLGVGLAVAALVAGGGTALVAGASTSPAAQPAGSDGASGKGTGLQGRYYANETLRGRPAARSVGAVDLNLLGRGPLPGIGAEHWSARWTGELEVVSSGPTTFTTTSDDGVRLWIDNTLVIDDWTLHSDRQDSATVQLTAGRPASIRMEYFQAAGWATARLAMAEPGRPLAPIPASRLYPRAGQAPRGAAPTPTPSSPPASSPSSPSPSPSSPGRPAGTVTLMPIGDSLTAEPSWRTALYDQLTAQGHQVEMVGPKHEPAGPSGGNAGFGGYTIDCRPTQVGNLADVVPGAVRDARPTAALVLAGVNDWFNCKDDPKTDPDKDSPGRLLAMLDAAHAASPGTRFYVASMLKTQFDADFGQHGFNQAVEAGLAKRSSYATFVDLHDLVDLKDGDWLPGGLHLTASGNAKLAKAWDGVLDPALRAPAAPAPTTPPAPSPNPSPTGGDPADCATPSTTLDAALILANETGDHCGRMEGVPDAYSWALHPENGGKPVGDSMLTWGQVYPKTGVNPNPNAWVGLKDAELWTLSRSTGRWTQLSKDHDVEGASWCADFHCGGEPGIQRRNGAGELEVQAVPGRNFHFWGRSGSQGVNDVGDVAAIVAVLKARVVGSDSSDYLACTGVDYRAGGATGQVVGSLGLGKCRSVTKDWQFITLSNATADQLRSFPGLPRGAGD